ncbi:MAG: carbamate kinase [Acidimicrobiia bacterium]
MRLVVALGGNALLKSAEAMTSENQRRNVQIACDQLASVATHHDLVVSHGNGPQVGLLALQNEAYAEVPVYPLDVLDAETQGMIGYMVEQELGNRLPFNYPIATLLTMIEVDPKDPAFENPTKPIGPRYSRQEADDLAEQHGWRFSETSDGWRRVVPSPRPQRIFELRQIRWLLDQGCVVICAGGGGIPTMYVEDRQLVGVEAVIDKDHASRLLASGVDADTFVMATDANGVYVDWGTDQQRQIAKVHPAVLLDMLGSFPEGSMRPKVQAACDFARDTGKPALIGALADIVPMLDGDAGTFVSKEIEGIVYRTEIG